MSGLLEEALEAHGGARRWREAQSVSARVRSGGLMLRTRVPGTRFADYRLTVDLRLRRVVIDPFPRVGKRAVYDDGAVRVETADGEVLESRAEPRKAFFGLSGIRRNLRWDALDSTYFAGYAMWNYLATPHLLTADGIETREGESWTEGGETWRRLRASFAPEIHTHSTSQTFYFDARGLLRRHDYTPEVVGRWARAAHYCAEHVQAGGLVFPTSRRVVPIGIANRALPGPTLVSIELSDLHVEPHRTTE